MTESIKSNMVAVYFASVIPAFLTFLFWIVTANYTSTATIGTIATVVSFSMILVAVSDFALPIGMKRYLGKVSAEKNFTLFKQMASSSTLFAFICSIVILVIFLNPFYNFFELIGIDEQFSPIIIAIVIGSSLQHIFRGIIISSLKSKSMIIPSIISSLVRFPVLIIFYYWFELNDISVGYAYSIFFYLFTVILLVNVILVLKKIPGSFFKDIFKNIRIAMQGGLPKWIPQILDTLGERLSIITIFAISGAAESGLAYIPFAIFSFLHMVPGAINQVSHPVLSGMSTRESAQKLLKKSVKAAFLASMPLVAILYFYADPILSIFGSEYVISNDILSVLLIALPVAIIGESIYFLLHSQEKYKQVLLLGLVGNIPRMILYFILVPMYGGVGAAIAFSIGFGLQAIFAVILSRQIDLKLNYLQYLAIILIPISIGFILDLLEIGFFGILLILLISFLAYVRIGIIDENNIKSILEIIYTPNKAEIVHKKLIENLKHLHIM